MQTGHTIREKRSPGFGLPDLFQYRPKRHPWVLRAAFFFPEPFPTLQDGALAPLGVGLKLATEKRQAAIVIDHIEEKPADN
jgi:hypothetical protein